MTPTQGLLRTAAAFALLTLAAPAALPAVAPAAQAQETGTVAVDLVESVGADWFAEIGDRVVVLRRIDGIDPTTGAGQQQLQDLDIPALVAGGAQFEEVDRATTVDGKAQFTGVAQGVYLLEVLDSPDTNDARVSYSPVVVVVARGSMTRSVAPKAQVLGVAANALTACTTPRWLDAAAPNTYIEYDYAFSVPNPSTDGTIVGYEITFDFSRGHTVQWESQPVVITAAGRVSADAYVFTAAADTVTVAAREPRWKILMPDTRENSTVVKLSKPTLAIVSASGRTELSEGRDYTVDVSGNDRATFTLTPTAREKLATARHSDPNARLEVRVPAKANATGPWGTVKRGEVLGTLETTATLRTDGMGALREPVEVARTSHVNVVSRANCFGTTGGDGGGGGGTTVPGGPGAPGQPGQPGSGQPGSGGTVTKGDGPGGAQGGSQSGGSQSGGGTTTRSGLASTGASVLGITGLALALIVLGLIIRRRDSKEEHSAS